MEKDLYMQETRKIDDLGRVVIPKGMREALNLTENGEVIIHCKDSKITITNKESH